MPFGYLGTTPNQQLKNSGVFSVEEVLAVENNGEWGGSYELIESQTITSSTAAVDFTNIKGAKYDVHYITITGFETAGGGQSLITVRYSTDGGSSFVESGYQNGYKQMFANGTFNDLKSTSESGIRVGFNNGTEQGSGDVYLYNLNNSSKYSFNTFQNIQENGCLAFGGGVYPTANTVNAIRVYDPVNMDNAIVKLYGVKEL